MALRSSPNRYGTMAAALHWLSALAILMMLGSGQAMDWAATEAAVAAILPVHAALGILVGVLTLFRILWWMAFDRHPEPLAGMSRTQERLASVVHLGLYVAILVMVASGVAMNVLTNALPQILAGGAVPDFSATPPYGVHDIVSKLLLLLVIGHVGAALWHQFVRRDGLIGRMRLGG